MSHSDPPKGLKLRGFTSPQFFLSLWVSRRGPPLTAVGLGGLAAHIRLFKHGFRGLNSGLHTYWLYHLLRFHSRSFEQTETSGSEFQLTRSREGLKRHLTPWMVAKWPSSQAATRGVNTRSPMLLGPKNQGVRKTCASFFGSWCGHWETGAKTWLSQSPCSYQSRLSVAMQMPERHPPISIPPYRQVGEKREQKNGLRLPPTLHNLEQEHLIQKEKKINFIPRVPVAK